MRISDWSSDVCENAGGNALVAERVAPMDARVGDSKSLLRYGIGDVWIGRSINPDVPACCRQIPGPRLIAVLARDRDCAVIARKDRKSTRLNSSHKCASRMPSSA